LAGRLAPSFPTHKLKYSPVPPRTDLFVGGNLIFSQSRLGAAKRPDSRWIVGQPEITGRARPNYPQSLTLAVK